MNRKIFSMIGLIFLSILLFGAGVWVGQAQAFNTNWQSGWMMGNPNSAVRPNTGMMNGNVMGMMMNNGMMGSNMMGSGMMNGNMMGSYGDTPNAESNITADEAVTIAQEYLDAYLPGKTADDHADTFSGYYTLHILEDGQPIGMMSVNAYTGQAFLHHWHSDFIEMSEGE